VPDSTGNHEAHRQESYTLQDYLFAHDEPGEWREDAIGGEKDLRLLVIKRLQVYESAEFHAPLL
jgi:hypothetical protein